MGWHVQRLLLAHRRTAEQVALRRPARDELDALLDILERRAAVADAPPQAFAIPESRRQH
jgi:hypothetical protein